MFQMCEWFTSKKELMKLGIEVLTLPKNKIESALYNNRTNIHDAAHDVLSEWRDQYETQEEAYHSLYTRLKERKMNQWATQLQQLARESETTTPGLNSSEKGSSLTIFWIEMFL